MQDWEEAWATAEQSRLAEERERLLARSSHWAALRQRRKSTKERLQKEQRREQQEQQRLLQQQRLQQRKSESESDLEEQSLQSLQDS
jgi:hypothetical protein